MTQIHSENRPGYLYFRMEGKPQDLEEAKEIMLKVMADIRASKHNRVMYVMDKAERKIKMEDFYKLAGMIGKDGAGTRTAVVAPSEQHTPEVAFFELAVGSAGSMIRYFTDEKKAEEWLRQP